MPVFDLGCPLTGEAVVITLEGFEIRGAPEFRGFSCELEEQCRNDGVSCALLHANGAHPFTVADALRFLGA